MFNNLLLHAGGHLCCSRCYQIFVHLKSQEWQLLNYNDINILFVLLVIIGFIDDF